MRSFDKSTIANFPSHKVKLGENISNSSATGYHDQSQPIYGMPIDMYPGQQQPPTHIGDKFADLRMFGPSARERGSSGPATTGPIFNELPRYASEPPLATQALNYPVGRFAYDHGRSSHMAGQSAHIAGRSGTGLFEEDCYLNPHPSQQHFPSQYTMHQHHSLPFQTRGGEYFPTHRRPGRDDQSYEPHRPNFSTPQN
jgi:hypothetical protein